MSYLCANLTSQTCASWVQAIGSVLAIVGAAGIAIWQSHKQYKNALLLQVEERRNARLEIARTISVLANICFKTMDFLTAQLNSREAVDKVAEGLVYLDINELSRQDAAIAAISLHNLPSSLVTPMMVLSSIIRQFRQNIDGALRNHRTMDAQAFDDFFHAVADLKESLKGTCEDIVKAVERIKTEV